METDNSVLFLYCFIHLQITKHLALSSNSDFFFYSLASLFHVFCTFPPSQNTCEKGKTQGLTPSLNICHFNNQSILQPLREGSTFMGFAQSDGLTGCYWFMPQPHMSIQPLLGWFTEKKNHLHWSVWLVSRWLSRSVPQQFKTPVGTLHLKC